MKIFLAAFYCESCVQPHVAGFFSSCGIKHPRGFPWQRNMWRKPLSEIPNHQPGVLPRDNLSPIPQVHKAVWKSWWGGSTPPCLEVGRVGDPHP